MNDNQQTTIEPAFDNWIAVVLSKETPAKLFEDSTVIESVLVQVEEMARDFTPDTSTDKGRKAIASQAFKVARTKTGLDEAGKQLTTEWKAKIAIIDANRKRVRDRLDNLKNEIRKPLTEWEQADAERIEDHRQTLAAIRQIADRNYIRNPSRMTADQLTGLQESLDEYRQRDWEEFEKEAETLIDRALSEIDLAKEILAENVRRAEAERLAKEERQRLEAERAEAERLAKEERQRLEAEHAEAERLAKEERQRLEAERAEFKAQQEQLDQERKEFERARSAPAPVAIPVVVAVEPVPEIKVEAIEVKPMATAPIPTAIDALRRLLSIALKVDQTVMQNHPIDDDVHEFEAAIRDAEMAVNS